ncbi:hypothetical protein [uncultured Tenacibaculum sp.]|uniref:hypothetical protein n=1 Tax=uncultured Tenacibaculum sp. TaxID=174713 RepID=UPI00260D0D63|nr:hypothetical protein [uncultured Tenacibaculum sp.]
MTLLSLLTFYSCAYEAQNREKLESSFENNFGFKPPESIKKIKLKNWGMYDTQVHWMSFTHNQTVLDKIIAHDQPLNIAEKNNEEFKHIVEELQKGTHNPKWLKIPNDKTDKVYYKRDFLDHTFSEYYLWTNSETGMSYLYVHFFD